MGREYHGPNKLPSLLPIWKYFTLKPTSASSLFASNHRSPTARCHLLLSSYQNTWLAACFPSSYCRCCQASFVIIRSCRDKRRHCFPSCSPPPASLCRLKAALPPLACLPGSSETCLTYHQHPHIPSRLSPSSKNPYAFIFLRLFSLFE